ncbi:MAG: UTP--glucose-1-phosphate uridylyltransferase [Hyphomonadaceae bacterium]|nr:MAG: UTP--glucose-1-phosphate uridylyltransferase [Caulobacteraceae bacterium]MBT9447335.1 UTP--glucose-1-phosphate uridylyltransferase [Hyphomonadaceae bacterium]TPW06356.1 MAG: UTP--glucose-1-phosphate uridylyltransferase [Alphaproteobacteria bacterium]
MTRKIRKAILPVAGFGTRVLPATKAVPKEMLAVFDRPAIQYVVDEARAAGIEHIVFVTGRNKSAIEDYFDVAYELEESLRAKSKTALIEDLRPTRLEAGAASFVRQQEPKGLGHAVWCARDIIGDEPFALLLPDMIMLPDANAPGCLEAMIAAHAAHGGNIIGVNAVAPEFAHLYGIVAVGAKKDIGFEISGMVEKPPAGTAPSNLYINGRYVLQPEIFDILATQERGAGGEIQITDGMRKLMSWQPFHGVEFQGRVYDCGDKIGYLRATAALAMANAAYGADAVAALQDELAIAARHRPA